MRLKFCVSLLVLIVGMVSCNEPLETITIEREAYALTAMCFEDSTFMARVTEGDSGYNYLGSWKGGFEDGETITINITRKDFNTLTKNAEMHFVNQNGKWSTLEDLQHVEALKDRTIYDKDE